jgi:hypothetical protein
VCCIVPFDGRAQSVSVDVLYNSLHPYAEQRARTHGSTSVRASVGWFCVNRRWSVERIRLVSGSIASVTLYSLCVRLYDVDESTLTYRHVTCNQTVAAAAAAAVTMITTDYWLVCYTTYVYAILTLFGLPLFPLSARTPPSLQLQLIEPTTSRSVYIFVQLFAVLNFVQIQIVSRATIISALTLLTIDRALVSLICRNS